MPQDSLRSAVYRSFITCDDPKGVVECGTIKKSKAGSQKKEHKIESQRTQKNLSTSSTYKEEKKEMVSMRGTEELRNPSSFQLLEVSRGAQKLNHTIDSWSKGISFEGQSKDIAKDLLKGALDLQESLVMLGKLQEASQYMARLKKKQKQRSVGGRFDGMEDGQMETSQSGNHNYHMGFQRPRLSVDGSSRDCSDELKTMIAESLSRQNLLPNTTTEKRAYFNLRNYDLASEVPSTSSSQSSVVHSSNIEFTDSSLSSAAPRSKAKGPSLIAKLMGVEEFPSRPLQTASQKQPEGEKISNQQKPIFDIDMPKSRKPQYVFPKVDQEQMALKEILETMQFKGLLKSNSVQGRVLQSHHSNTSHSKQRSKHDMPPIVIIKPLHFPCLESEEPLAPKFTKEKGAMETREMLKKLKGELPPATVDRKKEASNSRKTHRKLEAEETPIKRLSKEEGITEVVVGKPEEKEVKIKEKASRKVKASVTINHKPDRKEPVDKKAERIRKMTPTRRKPVEDNVKFKNVPRSQDAKVTTAKPRKLENKSNVTIPQQPSTSPNATSRRTTQMVVQNSSDQKKSQIKKENQVKEPPEANLITDFVVKEDDKRIDPTDENESVLNRTKSSLADQLTAQEKTLASEVQIAEHCTDGQTSHCEFKLLAKEHERGTRSTEDSNIYSGHVKDEEKSFKSRINLKYLLLRSASFLGHAEEVFDLNIYHPKILQTLNGIDYGDANTRLSLDCANELMQRKSLQESQSVHPLLKSFLGNSRICISLGQLIEEVCDGVENLKSYGKLAVENLHTDSIYAMLDRDLKCKEVISGAWDLGWRNGFSMDEAEQVVAGIEKLVLGGLIEEVFTDFVL